jgi:hypothetical protein
VKDWENRKWSSARDFEEYEGGTLSSECGPMPLFGTVWQLGKAPKIKSGEKKCAAGCGKPWVNKWTNFCEWHQAFHEQRNLVREGKQTEEEYAAWYEKNKQFCP